jgi:glycine dehydrogenase subunit 1
VAQVNRYLLDKWEILGGYDLSKDYPNMKKHMLVAVTEVNSREEIDFFVDALRQYREALNSEELNYD